MVSELRLLVLIKGRSILLGLITFASLTFSQAQQLLSPPELELISIHALANYQDRFDFSGIVMDQQGYLAIADKHWNQYAYRIDIDSNYWYITDSVKLGLTNHTDLEGIDICDGGGIYFIDEKFC